MRVFALLLFAASVAASPCDVTKTLDISADVSHLTDAQRAWLDAFESGLPNADSLPVLAANARKAGLRTTAAYLDTASRALRGEATVEDVERAFRDTLDEPLYVMLRVENGAITDTVTAIPNRALSPRVSRASIDAFERTLPGFTSAWLAPVVPEEQARVASLHRRIGKSAASASHGTYLPFDRALNPKVGRTWIVYDNVLPQVWSATKMEPAAAAVMPSIASHVKGDALLLWYALRTPIYDAGPNLTRAQLEAFGADKDPYRVLKADILCTLAAGASDDDLATLLAVTWQTLFETYAGTAPPQHRASSTAIINWAAAHDAIRFDNGLWTADLPALRKTLRDLAQEILESESTLDVARIHALMAKYGSATPEIDRTVVALAALPKTTVVPRYASPR